MHLALPLKTLIARDFTIDILIAHDLARPGRLDCIGTWTPGLARRHDAAIGSRDGIHGLALRRGLRHPYSQFECAVLFREWRARARASVLHIAIARFKMHAIARFEHLIDRTECGLDIRDLRDQSYGFVLVIDAPNFPLAVMCDCRTVGGFEAWAIDREIGLPHGKVSADTRGHYRVNCPGVDLNRDALPFPLK